MTPLKKPTESKMSDTRFLDPVSAANNIVYVQVKDTSGQSIHLKKSIADNVTATGGTMTTDPDEEKGMIEGKVL